MAKTKFIVLLRVCLDFNSEIHGSKQLKSKNFFKHYLKFCKLLLSVILLSEKLKGP